MPAPSSPHVATRLIAAADDELALLERARGGDAAAVEQLYLRHRDVALRVAGRLCDPEDVEDVVADAFTRVLAQIARGGGPRTSFRAYLVTAVRHAHVDLVRAESGMVLQSEPTGVDGEPLAPDEGDRRDERQVLRAALASLPQRWQAVVWMTVVEGRSLGEVAERLGITPNAAAAVAFRARSGLRDAYLRQHLDRAPSGEAIGLDELRDALGRVAAAR